MRFWLDLLYLLLAPAVLRRQRCVAAGKHRPEPIDGGRSKLCVECVTW